MSQPICGECMKIIYVKRGKIIKVVENIRNMLLVTAYTCEQAQDDLSVNIKFDPMLKQIASIIWTLTVCHPMTESYKVYVESINKLKMLLDLHQKDSSPYVNMLKRHYEDKLNHDYETYLKYIHRVESFINNVYVLKC